MIGARLGPWIIEEEVGRGGMGAVYRASRAADAPAGPDRAAVKVLAAELAVEVGFQQRFQREIDILRQLDHPAIVRLFDSGQTANRFWFAMEYIDGPSYEDLRGEGGRLPWLEVLDLAWQVAPALKHAHDRGVIHRDLKPSNLLLNVARHGVAGHTAKLTDFGIASLFSSPHLTVTGGVIGTPEYLSPEQAAGKPVTKKSDLYSLGVLLYALATGTTPFVGEPIDLLHKHRFAQFDRPGRLVPDMHPDFEEIICSLLEKDPAARPGDAGVLFRRLDSLRKKLARRAERETVDPGTDVTPLPPREGPATMVSRIVREELERQNRPGPVGRLLNNPFILIPLFLLCVGTLVWTFWPTSSASLYQRGVRLMESDNPADWDRAWSECFEPLSKRFPDHPYKQEVAELRQRYDDLRAERKAAAAARGKGALSEGQWFFEKGRRLRAEGKEAEARAAWEALIAGFADVPAERPWVRRAEQEMAKQPGADATGLDSLREALKRAKKLEAEGERKQAEEVRKGLRVLYRGNAAAEAILNVE